MLRGRGRGRKDRRTREMREMEEDVEKGHNERNRVKEDRKRQGVGRKEGTNGNR